jgi:hypothetical protein
MYYRDIESDIREAKAHTERQQKNASARLAKIAAAKKARKAR